MGSTPEELVRAVEEMRKTNRKFAEEVERLQKEAGQFGTILSLDDERAIVGLPMGGGIKFPVIPKELKQKAYPGATAVLNQEGNITTILPPRAPFMEVRVVRHLDDGMTEVEKNGDNVVIYSGSPENRALPRGATVLTDMSGHVIIRELEQEKMKQSFSRISWDDIGGMQRIKEQIIDAVIGPLRNPAVYAKYGRSAPKGIVMHGPPGCGKTLLGRAIASALSDDDSGALFSYIKSTELLSSYVGASEQAIRGLFAKSRRHKEETGHTPVIFIDEADAILYRRGTGISSDVDRTIVPTFLTEMDGLDSSAALVILSTNRVDTLDPAILRDGRMDVKIKVDRPDRESMHQIMRIVFKNVLKADPLEEIAQTGVDEIGREDYILRGANGRKAVLLRDVSTGAMAANIAGRSAGEAMRRDMKASVKSKKGVRVGDVREAVKQIYEENLEVVHD